MDRLAEADGGDLRRERHARRVEEEDLLLRVRLAAEARVEEEAVLHMLAAFRVRACVRKSERGSV